MARLGKCVICDGQGRVTEVSIGSEKQIICPMCDGYGMLYNPPHLFLAWFGYAWIHIKRLLGGRK